MLAFPQTPQALEVTKLRSSAVSGGAHARREIDVDHVVGVAAVGVHRVAVPQPGDVLRAGDDALGGEEAVHEVEVVAGRAHGDRQRGAVQPDLQRLLGGHRVGPGGVLRSADAQHRRPARHSSHAEDGTQPYGSRMSTLPPYTAVVLAGGRAARLGGRAKPQLEVGGRTMLAAVLAAVADAQRGWSSAHRQPVPDDVVLVREQPPGGGPVAALRAGLDEVSTDVVALLAGDLPFLTADLVAQLRGLLTGDGVLVVDDGGREQWLLGVWRTAALRDGDARGQRADVAAEGARAAGGRRACARRRHRDSRRPGWTATPRPTSAAPAPRRATPNPRRPRGRRLLRAVEPSVWPLFRSPGEG